VARQRELFAKLKAAGCSLRDAERNLSLFQDVLEIFEQHERELLEHAPPRLTPPVTAHP